MLVCLAPLTSPAGLSREAVGLELTGGWKEEALPQKLRGRTQNEGGFSSVYRLVGWGTVLTPGPHARGLAPRPGNTHRTPAQSLSSVAPCTKARGGHAVCEACGSGNEDFTDFVHKNLWPKVGKGRAREKESHIDSDELMGEWWWV